MSKIQQIRALVRNGLYYLTEHANDEALEEGFDIYDVEYGILNGKVGRAWPREGKYEVVGCALEQNPDHHSSQGSSEAMKKGRTAATIWEGERCEYCNGLIREKSTDLSRKVKGKYAVIENVPTGVCTECGTRYYTANVVKSIEETLRGRRKAKRAVQTPVYSL